MAAQKPSQTGTPLRNIQGNFPPHRNLKTNRPPQPRMAEMPLRLFQRSRGGKLPGLVPIPVTVFFFFFGGGGQNSVLIVQPSCWLHLGRLKEGLWQRSREVSLLCKLNFRLCWLLEAHGIELTNCSLTEPRVCGMRAPAAITFLMPRAHARAQVPSPEFELVSRYCFNMLRYPENREGRLLPGP